MIGAAQLQGQDDKHDTRQPDCKQALVSLNLRVNFKPVTTKKPYLLYPY